MYSLIPTGGQRPEKLKRSQNSVLSVSEFILTDDARYSRMTSSQAMAVSLNSLISRVPEGEWFLYLADDEILEGNPLPYLERETDFLTIRNRAANPANESSTRYNPIFENYLYTRFVKKAYDTRFIEYHWILHHKGITRNHHNAQLSAVIPDDVMVREIW